MAKRFTGIGFGFLRILAGMSILHGRRRSLTSGDLVRVSRLARDESMRVNAKFDAIEEDRKE
jgi:hypothetical protein